MKGGKSKAEAKTRKRLGVKKRGGASERVSKAPAKKTKPTKDPNKPKRPASAFIVFMDDFWWQYKEKHPNKVCVTVVAKAGVDKWKSLSEAEKAPYVAKAEKRNADYDKTMIADNKKSAEGKNDDEEELTSRGQRCTMTTKTMRTRVERMMMMMSKVVIDGGEE